MTSPVNWSDHQNDKKEIVEDAMPAIVQNPARPDSWMHRLGLAVKTGWDDGTGAYRRRRKEKDLSEENGFKYEPLPLPSCIRLLTLEPGKPADVVRVSLRTIDLNDKPIYTALSYAWERGTTWGESWSLAARDVLKETLHLPADKKDPGGLDGVEDPKNDQDETESRDRKIITCNGRTMKVFPNLYDALVELRLRNAGDYWIDAVCMNQLDTHERTAQVAIMGQIYQAANSVTVWLGTCPAALTLSLETQVARAKLATSPPPAGGGDELAEPDTRLGIVSLWYLFTRRWFKRMWTVQEVCFARKITFRLGKHEISQETLLSFTEKSKVKNLNPYVDLTKWTTHISNIGAVLESRQFFQEGGRWTLDQWLHTAKGRKVKQARDLIYGGISLIQADSLRIHQNLQLCSDGSPPAVHQGLASSFEARPLWQKIDADYNAATSEVFLNLAACLLSQPNGLKVLFSTLPLFWDHRPVPLDYQHFVEQDPFLERQMPSWMPNPKFWTSPKLEPIGSVDNSNIFAACGQLANNPRISTDGKVLHLDVARLDQIDKIWPVQRDDLGPLELPVHLITYIQALSKHGGPLAKDKSSESPLVTFAHVAVGGRLSKADALVGLCSFLPMQISELKKVRRLLRPKQDEVMQDESGLDLSPDEALSTHYTDAQLETFWIEVKARYPEAPWPLEGSKSLAAHDIPLRNAFMESYINMTQLRRIFTTNGGNLCLGYKSIQRGDQVMAVKGIEVPYIFRRADDDLRRRADDIQALITEFVSGKQRHDVDGIVKMLKAELLRIDSRVGEHDGYVLVGDAYMDGVMYGEAVYEGLQFERLNIV